MIACEFRESTQGSDIDRQNFTASHWSTNCKMIIEKRVSMIKSFLSNQNWYHINGHHETTWMIGFRITSWILMKENFSRKYLWTKILTYKDNGVNYL